MSHDPVTVIINAYNEAETIEQEIRDIFREIIDRLPGSELIVAEDGSTDGTKEIIHRLKTEFDFVHSTSEQRKGYARSFADAVALARHPFIFFSDTGNKFNFRDFWPLYNARNEGEVVTAVRTGRTDQLYRRLMTWLYNAALRLYFGVDLRDADAGFRLYRQEVLRKIANEPWINKNLIASELALRAVYSGYRIREVPVSYRQRSGESRGLPVRRMPRVIAGVLRNFRRLKKVLTADGYRITCSAAKNAGRQL